MLAGVTWNRVSTVNDGELNYLKINGPANMSMVHAKDVGHSSFWKSLPIMENGSVHLSNF